MGCVSSTERVHRLETSVNVTLLLLLLGVASVQGETLTPPSTSGFIEDERRPRVGIATEVEPAFTGWSLYIDNDLLTPFPSDRDYTAGFAFTLSGQETTQYPWSVDDLLGNIDGLTGLPTTAETGFKSLHSLEFGMNLFTPGDITIPTPIKDDRPYASLIYLANTHQLLLPERRRVRISTLSVGILGSRLPGDLQQGIHDAIDFREPKGWDLQISNGGELTAKYALSSQHMIKSGLFGDDGRYDVTTAIRGSVGYITELSLGISSRVGNIYSDWWTFNPNLSDYAEKSLPIAASRLHNSPQKSEAYFWYGANIRLRIYNAFLQGQFRHSEVTIDQEDIYPLLGESWIGYTRQIDNDWRLSYLLRMQTPEIRVGDGDRIVMWGGIIIGRSL